MALVVAAAAWFVAVAGYVYTLVVRLRLDAIGRPELAFEVSEAVVYGAALISAVTVGAAIAFRRPRHPVGWLFLTLGVALAVGAAGDAYALDHGVADGNVDSAAAGLALVAGQASFIAWFGLAAAVLHLTPTGRPASLRWSQLLWVSSAATVVGLLAKLIQDTPFEPPYAELHNPWAVAAFAVPVDAVAAIAITVVALGLIGAGLSLVMRFRRGSPFERRRLRWMAIIAVALPLTLAASFVAVWTDVDAVRTIATGGFVALLPIAAGLSVQQYRLYDVDRILGRATAYMLSTLTIGGVYLVVVTLAGATVGAFADESVLPAVLATFVAVTSAAPLHRRVQEAVDKRFDRRRHDARRLVADHLRSPSPGGSIAATLASALGDPSLVVSYWIGAKEQWVTADGQPAAVGGDDIEVVRDGEPVARVAIDPDAVDARLARELAAVSVNELDNVRLRAALALQLEEVRDSRARIVSAQTSERRRIERNLHDGAQQRLLALAMQLRGAQLRSAVDADVELLDRAIDEISASVRELRDLANGLHPTVLTDGGLAAALDELAGRVPLKVQLDLDPLRLDPTVEETLWFVACEAVANTVKHADADTLSMALSSDGTQVRLLCRDDGRGRADPGGSGLRGIADRVEAVGGRLHVVSAPDSGTTVEAVIPCAS